MKITELWLQFRVWFQFKQGLSNWFFEIRWGGTAGLNDFRSNHLEKRKKQKLLKTTWLSLSLFLRVFESLCQPHQSGCIPLRWAVNITSNVHCSSATTNLFPRKQCIGTTHGWTSCLQLPSAAPNPIESDHLFLFTDSFIQWDGISLRQLHERYTQQMLIKQNHLFATPSGPNFHRFRSFHDWTFGLFDNFAINGRINAEKC